MMSIVSYIPVMMTKHWCKSVPVPMYTVVATAYIVEGREVIAIIEDIIIPQLIRQTRTNTKNNQTVFQDMMIQV